MVSAEASIMELRAREVTGFSMGVKYRYALLDLMREVSVRVTL